jgi:hypothetical protein
MQRFLPRAAVLTAIILGSEPKGFTQTPAVVDPAPPGVKVCVLLADTKKSTKAEYRGKEVEYCLPKLPSLLGWFKPHGTSCAECGPPLCRRVLLKRFVTVECPGTKCEPQVLPAPPPCPPCPVPGPVGSEPSGQASGDADEARRPR